MTRIDRTLTGTGSGRRSERVFLRIPIELEGKDAEGKPFRERTFTLVINRHGARICAYRSLVPDERVTITNVQTGVGVPFRVVGRAGKSLGEGPEWGVECLEPEVDIWGIYFPTRTLTPAQEELVDALLECSGCRSKELAKLTITQYRQLADHGVVNRACGTCHTEREWHFGFVEGETEPIPSQEGSAGSEGPERRRAKRLTVKLPVRIRLQDGREEVARTENLSQTGLCFVSDLEIKSGDLIRLTVGYSPSGREEEVAARVVWRKHLEGTNRFAYGVHIEGSH